MKLDGTTKRSSAWAKLIVCGLLVPACGETGVVVDDDGEGMQEHCGDQPYFNAHPMLCSGGCKDPAKRNTPDCVPCEGAPDDPLCGTSCSTEGCDTDTTGPTTGEPTSTTNAVTDTDTDTETGTDTGAPAGGVVEVVAGGSHTCALTDAGTVRCWGASSSFLGYGNYETIGDDEVPADVGDIDVGGTVVDIDSGRSHVCAVLDTGGVRCWGLGDLGQLGLGDISVYAIGAEDVPSDHSPIWYNPGAADPLNDPPPADVPLAMAVTAGVTSTCVLLDTGRVWCWGHGLMVSQSPTPLGDNEHASVVPLKIFEFGIAEVSSGGHFGCVRSTTGSVHCWGDAPGAGMSAGGLGYGNTNPVTMEVFAPPVSFGSTALKVIHGEQTTCVLTANDDVHCWGANVRGQLGIGSTENIGDDELPTVGGPAVIGGPAADVCNSLNFTCAVLQDGTVRCFGANDFGQLGYGHFDDIGDDELPATEPAIDFSPRNAVSLGCGSNHVCAVLDDANLRCWGLNSSGQLGLGQIGDVNDPTDPMVQDVQVVP